MTLLLRMCVTLTWLLACATVLAQNEASAPPAAGPASQNGKNAAAAEQKYYAVTLIAAFEPVDIRATAKEFPTQDVYLVQSNVLGRAVYFVRLGFFPTFADANSMKDKLLARYPGAWSTSVTGTERVTARGPGQKTTPPPAAPTPKPAEETVYALTLATSADIKPVNPLPGELSANRLYLYPIKRNGKTLNQLRLGFFASQDEAQRARDLLASAYPGITISKASKEEQGASASAPAPMAETLPAPPPAPVPATEPVAAAGKADTATDKLAEPLMNQGRDALTQNNNALAIQSFDRLLNLPPNKYSQDAQEFIGLARERNGEIAKANAEYKLYLKLYPDSEGADRVRQRLLNLGRVKIQEPRQKLEKKDIHQTIVYGSWSQYYYHGTTQNTDTTLNVPVPIATSTSATVQSLLTSTLDLNVRIRSNEFDNRAVIRDTFSWNLLDHRRNVNRLNSAYFELKDRKYEYSARLGRQPGNSGGVLGRFDGLQAGYRISPKWQINAVVGSPADLTISSDVKFHGLSLDMGTFAEHWSGSAYWIAQEVDGIADRNALGGDVRYYDPHQSYYSLVDYDMLYGALNTVLFQGTWITESQTTYNMLLDHRKAPTLQTTNAVLGTQETSIQKLLLTTTEEALRQQAQDNTPTSSVYLLGFTRPFNATWQYGADIRNFKTSDTLLGPGSSTTMYTVQGIGTGLFVQRDITVLSYAYSDSSTYTVNSLTLNNRSLFGSKWTLKPGLQYSLQRSANGSETKRLRPSLELDYKWKENINLEVEIDEEINKTVSSTTQTDRRDPSYWLGYRWDF